MIASTNNSLFQNVDISDNSNACFNKDYEALKQSPIQLNSTDQISVESDAWPQEQLCQVKSRVHQIIRKKLQYIDPSKIYFDQIGAKHVEEIKKLHEEWFPLNYPKSFYERINRNNIIAIGCFIDIEDMPEQKKNNKKKEKKMKVILGTIMVKINKSNEDVGDIYKAKDFSNGGITSWIKHTLTCREYVNIIHK